MKLNELKRLHKKISKENADYSYECSKIRIELTRYEDIVDKTKDLIGGIRDESIGFRWFLINVHPTNIVDFLDSYILKNFKKEVEQEAEKIALQVKKVMDSIDRRRGWEVLQRKNEHKMLEKVLRFLRPENHYIKGFYDKSHKLLKSQKIQDLVFEKLRKDIKGFKTDLVNLDAPEIKVNYLLQRYIEVYEGLKAGEVIKSFSDSFYLDCPYDDLDSITFQVGSLAIECFEDKLLKELELRITKEAKAYNVESVDFT